MSDFALQLFSNFTEGVVLAEPLTAEALTMTTSDVTVEKLRQPIDGEFQKVVIEDGLTREIVLITSNTFGVCVIERAQEDTVAHVFPAGAKVEDRLTRGTLEDLKAWVLSLP